jgi:hypothetical protein
MLSPSHLQFCQNIVSGLNGTQAYLAVYPRCTRRSAKDSASRLLAKKAIIAKITALRAATDDAPGSALHNLIERRKFLARCVRANGADLPENSDLWIAKKLSKADNELYLPDKIGAIVLDHLLSGHKLPAGFPLRALLPCRRRGFRRADPPPPRDARNPSPSEDLPCRP